MILPCIKLLKLINLLFINPTQVLNLFIELNIRFAALNFIGVMLFKEVNLELV